jgi:hypothetical protein
VALLAIGLAGGAYAETEKEGKAAKQESPASESKPAAEEKAKPDEPAAKTRQTPFGPVKATSEKPQPSSGLAADPFVSARQEGDVVIFSRKTPFGAQVWKKKKSELSDEERALLARDQPEASSAKPAASEADSKGASKSESAARP